MSSWPLFGLAVLPPRTDEVLDLLGVELVADA
jgi:hypothetical protein